MELEVTFRILANPAAAKRTWGEPMGESNGKPQPDLWDMFMANAKCVRSLQGDTKGQNGIGSVRDPPGSLRLDPSF